MIVAGAGVVVTGAGNGIGRALAVRLAAEGARVVVNDLDAAAARLVATEIGGFAVAGDAAGADGVAGLVDAARSHLGEIDMYVANAGVVRGMGIDATDDDWATSWEINTMAHVRAARLLLPSWLERGHGRFVITASAAGLQTTHGLPTYAVTKHAAVAFAEWLSLTYRHRGLTVQAICPQGVSTALLEQTGAVQAISTADGALTPEQVADEFWEGLQDDRFLILPHPETAKYYRRRAEDPDRWLQLMNRLQRTLETARASS